MSKLGFVLTGSSACRDLRLRLAAALVAAIVCAAALFAQAPVALADEDVTRTIGGLSYTLPSDWDAVDLDEYDDAAVLAEAGLAEYAAYQKGDGLFAAFAVEDSSAAAMTYEDVQEAANEAMEALSLTPLSGIRLLSSTEQGCPALTAYTDAIVLNDVTYALTCRLYFVDSASLTGTVLMMSLLPADGVIHEDLADTFPVTTEPTQLDLGGITYTVPAGVRMAEGSLLICDFVVGIGEDGGPYEGAGFFGTTYDLQGAYALVDVSDLQDSVDSLMDAYASGEFDDVLASLWAGATTFDGFPLIAAQATASGEESVEAEAVVAFTNEDVSALVVAEGADADASLADALMEDAVATGGTSVAGSTDGITSVPSDGDVQGFVVSAS